VPAAEPPVDDGVAWSLRADNTVCQDECLQWDLAIGARWQRQRAMLGIDAAWTASQSSGVVLVAQAQAGWRLVAAEASYRHFHDSAE
jgi:hypothetical protein